MMLNYLRHAEQAPRNGGGILACGMGLGKSLTMLVACICDRISNPTSDTKPTLIVAAPALFSVWQQQIQLHVKPNVLNMVQYNDSKQPEKTFANTSLVFCTYQRLCLDAKEHLGAAMPLVLNTPVQTLRVRQPLRQLPGLDEGTLLVERPLAKRGLFSRKWHRIVVDEADALRNVKSKRFRALLALAAQHRWWMTGTPLNNSFSDIVAAMLFLRDPHVCQERPLQLDPMGLLRGIRNEQEKRARQSFEQRAYVLTAQMVVEDYPHLIQQDERLRYLLAPVYMFQHAMPFRCDEERQVYKRMQDELVSVLRELKQCVVLQQPDRAEEVADVQNEHVLAYENEDDMEQEQQQLYQELQKKPNPKSLVHAAVENVRTSSNPQWSARATVNYFYLRTMQAAVMPSFADKALETSENQHYHVKCSLFEDLLMWMRERVPPTDKVVVYCMWTTVLRACRTALQQAGLEAVEFYGGMQAEEQAKALRRCASGDCRVLLAQTRVGGVGQT
jgi:SNF2 family DNA or RNA helicase